MRLPPDWIRRMQACLGPDYGAFEQALLGKRTWGLRFNPLRGKPPDLPWAMQPVAWCAQGRIYDGESVRPGRHAWHDAGVYYIQDPSAMAVAEVADVRPGMRVLDLCAAPGGKATHLAGKLAGEGLLVANEPVPGRAAQLAGNLERMGVRNAVTLCERPERLAQRWPAAFDRVVVDAPCSGEGLFRREPEAVWQWSEEAVEDCAARQRMILEAAATLTAVGGRLVYATCTFERAEDEDNADWFLSAHPDFAPVEVALPGWRPGLGGQPHCARLWPQSGLGEGHFLAAFERVAGAPAPTWTQERQQGTHAMPEWLDLWQAYTDEPPPEQVACHGDRRAWLPTGCPSLEGLRVIRAGLLTAQAVRGRLLPQHALAMAVPGREPVDLDLEDPALARYLAGETLPTAARSWVQVRAGGYPIGLGKGAGGILKNHIPTGLRHRGRTRGWNDVERGD